MTKEERIEKLRHLITCMKCEVSGKSCDDNCPTQYDAGNMGEIIENLEEIVKALEQEPKYCDRNICIRNDYNGIGCGECEVTKSQEPCEDCISRQAVLNILDDMVKDYINENDFDKAQGIAWVKVQKLPAVSSEKPKTGHWIKTKEQDDAEPLILWKCSECLTIQRLKTNYCPNCGARMAESEDKG